MLLKCLEDYWFVRRRHGPGGQRMIVNVMVVDSILFGEIIITKFNYFLGYTNRGVEFRNSILNVSVMVQKLENGVP